jgi:hypothetical protein
MRPKTFLLGLGLLAAAPTTLQAQILGMGVAPHVGTLGLGIDGAVALTGMVAVRGGLNFQPWHPEREISDVDFQLRPPSPSLTAMVDLHPGGGWFRFSGGLVYFGSDPEVDGVLADSVEIGGTMYAPEALGTLEGTLSTRDLSP